MKVTRLLRHYSATFPAWDLAPGVMGCLCQQIYLCKLGGSTAVTCTQTAPVICSVMEERCQLLNGPPSNILLEKNEVSEPKKNGNRPDYMKWCGASAGPEPILLVFLKARPPESPRWRACTGRVEGDNERVEKKNEMYTQAQILRYGQSIVAWEENGIVFLFVSKHEGGELIRRMDS